MSPLVLALSILAQTASQTVQDWYSRLQSLGLLGQIAMLVVISALFLAAGRFIVKPLVRRAMERAEWDRGVEKALARTVNAVFLFVGIFVALAAAGFGAILSSLSILGGATVIAVGFASQDVIGNFVAGIFLLSDKPFRVGDAVKIGDDMGVVEDIKFRTTRLKTFDGELLTLPNKHVAGSGVLNFQHYATRRIRVAVGVDYDTDLQQAIRLVLDEVGKDERVRADPAPQAVFTGFGGSSLDLEARFWIDSRGPLPAIQTDVSNRILERFRAEDVDIPFPHRTLVTKGPLPLQEIGGRGNGGGRRSSGDGRGKEPAERHGGLSEDEERTVEARRDASSATPSRGDAGAAERKPPPSGPRPRP